MDQGRQRPRELLQLQTSDLSVSLIGPLENRRGTLRDAARPVDGQLIVEVPADASVKSCYWRRPSGDFLPQDVPGVGPWLFEDTTYRIAIEGPPGQDVRLACRLHEVIANVSPALNHQNFLTGTINFRQQVGLAQLDIFCGGEKRLRICIEIFPTKISYLADYRDLVDDLERVTRALSMQYLSATSQGATEIASLDQRDLEWLLLLKHNVEPLGRALRYIAAHPDRDLNRELAFVRAEKARRPSRALLSAINRGSGSGPFVFAKGMRVRAKVPYMRAAETLDTAEHRWLRQRLITVHRKLQSIQTLLYAEQADRTARGLSCERINQEISEVRDFELVISESLAMDPLKSASGPAPANLSSLTLQTKPGYREAYNILLLLDYGLQIGSVEQLASQKDLDTLYEMWCFVKVIELVQKILGVSGDIIGLISIDSRGIRVDIKRGLRSEMICKTPSMTLTVTYNQGFTGLTGQQKPDIVIRLDYDDFPPILLIIDAKYRVDASERYLSHFRLPGPPLDAVNSLHRYRDAILLNTGSVEGRAVVKGVAVFPLSGKDSVEWCHTPLYQSLDSLGIGALPFLPANIEMVENWITSVLSSRVDAVAYPGPPFLAWEAVRSMKSGGKGQSP